MKYVNFLKKIITVILVLFFLTAHGQDYLKTATSTGFGVTTNNSKAWTNITSVTIDVTNISSVLLSASINMRPDGSSDKGREANYNIYGSGVPADESGIIKRQMVKNSETGVESWGVGTLIHIFDTSALAGDITYTLEHSNQGNIGVGRNVHSLARLTAVALTTALTGKELSNSVKRISTGVDTNTGVYEIIPGLITNAIILPIEGDIYVAASINSRANGNGSVAEYKLEYSIDGGAWGDLDFGKSVKRSMINTSDDGIISLVGLLQTQSAGNNYQFRVVHKRVSGTNTITTNNTNLVAIALSHDAGYFPSFLSEVGITGVDITGVSTAETVVASSSFTAAADIGGVGAGLYVHSQYLVSASNLEGTFKESMRAHNQLIIGDGTLVQSSDVYHRYIPNNSDFGSGGYIGLVEDLTAGGLYTISMKHGIDFVSAFDDGDETLTTSEVILAGFQTYDQPNTLLSVDDFELSKLGISIYSSDSSIYLKSEKPISTTIKVYNVLSQLIKVKQFINESTGLINVASYKGIVIVSLNIDGKIYTKKLIL